METARTHGELTRKNVVSALIFDESKQKVLLVKNDDGDTPYWSLPGGYVEGNETLIEAVIREVKEETGFTVRVENLYMVREVLFLKKRQHAFIFTFLATIVDGVKGISDPDQEVLQVEWVELSKANELLPYLPEKITADMPQSLYYFQQTGDV